MGKMKTFIRIRQKLSYFVILHTHIVSSRGRFIWGGTFINFAINIQGVRLFGIQEYILLTNVLQMVTTGNGFIYTSFYFYSCSWIPVEVRPTFFVWDIYWNFWKTGNFCCLLAIVVIKNATYPSNDMCFIENMNNNYLKPQQDSLC